MPIDAGCETQPRIARTLGATIGAPVACAARAAPVTNRRPGVPDDGIVIVASAGSSSARTCSFTFPVRF
jgi:hypothetical protein